MIDAFHSTCIGGIDCQTGMRTKFKSNCTGHKYEPANLAIFVISVLVHRMLGAAFGFDDVTVHLIF
jgi:hypothetical protein